MKEVQKNRITIISRNEYQHADIQTQSKQFYFDDNHIHYENKLEVMGNSIPKINGVNVVNNLCQIKDNKLIKTTIVYFQDKLIRIQDEFYLQNYTSNVKVETQSIPIKKTTQNPLPQPLKIPLNLNSDNYSSSVSQRMGKKKDLKNIVKNIVKIFIQWLNKSQNNIQECKQVMDDLLSLHKYNNSLIRAMSQNTRINKVFLQFLQASGEQMVQGSRIHDKKTHLEALKKYQSIFESGEKVVRATSVNGSCEERSRSSSDKDKFVNESNFYNNNFQKSEYQQGNDQNKGSSKGSDSDKIFSKSGSQNNNRNRLMMSSSNAENYPSGEDIAHRDNRIFFSSSGSDQ